MEKERVVVIGAGITGLTAAIELAKVGVETLVVEKGPLLGGHCAMLLCKATDRCLKCNNCLVENTFRQVKNESSFKFMTYTSISSISRKCGSFVITLQKAPCFIDWEKCTDCGSCYETCAQQRTGAIVRALSVNLHPLYGIDQQACSCLSEGVNPVCVEACPEGAINISDRASTVNVEASGIVLATGFEPYEPPKGNRFGYGHLPNVITTRQADLMLRNMGVVVRPSDGKVPQKIAFVQCVGSRDRRIGHEYCSRICCGYSLRMALHLLYKIPDLEITVFYMDIQNFGKDFERYYQEIKDKIRLVRGLPGDFYGIGDDNVSVSYYSQEIRKNIKELFDLVLLTVGLSPAQGIACITDGLDLSVTEEGFLAPMDPLATGVTVAGTARGPMDVAESICDGKRAALEIYRYLENKQ